MKDPLSRRHFLASAAACSTALWRAQASTRVPVGVMAFSIHRELEQDLPGTLRAISGMGYAGIEFWDPYYFWTPAYTKQVRSLLDECHLTCFSTHDESLAFTPDGLTRAIELNQILGSKSIVAARGLISPAHPHHGFEGKGVDGWKRMAETLALASERLQPLGMTCGFHNHAVEFVSLEGTRPIDILAGVANLVFHLDIGPCRQGQGDPITFMRQYAGRVHCVLCSDWPANAKGHQPVLGQGQEHWKDIFVTAEQTGGVRFYLVQQESSDESERETIRKDWEAFRSLHVL